MRKVIYFLIILIVTGLLTYKYIYKEHRNIRIEEADFIMETVDLISEFESNSGLASQKYLDRILEIKGSVTQINDGTISLDNAVLCYMIDSEIDSSVLNKKIVVKGRFIGYDDLLEEFKIDQASILNN